MIANKSCRLPLRPNIQAPDAKGFSQSRTAKVALRRKVMGRRFSSEIDAISPTRLKVKGCILGGLICKSQVWSRIERLPQ